MERYRILYMWKVLEGIVPNCGVNTAPYNKRWRKKVNIPGLKRNGRRAIQTMRENSFQINWARLFNSLPMKLRNMKCYQEDFKIAMENHLSSVPDQPQMGSLVPSATDQLSCWQSNSLLAWATHDQWHSDVSSTQCGQSPDCYQWCHL